MDSKEGLEQAVGQVTRGAPAPAPAPAPTLAPASAPTPDNNMMAAGGEKKSNGMLYGMILLAILAIGGIGFGVWAMMDGNSQKNNYEEQISALKRQLTESSQMVIEDNTIIDNDDSSSGSTGLDELYFLYDDLNLKDQRYRLMIIDKNNDDLMNNSSEDDEFYVLDMKKIGKDTSLKKIDLASLLKPLTDEIISSGLPNDSTNAVGEVTNKSQCESFSVTYYDPRSDLPGGGNEGWNMNSELPIKVSFFCHKNNNTELVKYYDLFYILNVESNSARQHSLEGKNNFKL